MKLHRKILKLLVLAFPVQLGFHFWPDWTYLWGLKIDYLSPTFYFTDLLIFALLGVWLWEERKNFSFKKAIIQRHQAGYRPKLRPDEGAAPDIKCRGIGIAGERNHPRRKILPFGIRKETPRLLAERGFLFLAQNRWFWILGIFFSLNIFLAQNRPASFFKLIKIGELFFFGFYLVRNDVSLKDLRLSLNLAVLWASLLALIQMVNQASLDGVFWWLGERTFSLSTPGIAKVILNGRLWLRPYGTFPHPNVLAGFLLTGLALLNEKKRRFNFKKILGLLSLALGAGVVALSFSRAAWAAGALAGTFLFLKDNPKLKLWPKYLTVFVWLVFLSLVFSLASRLPLKEAVFARIELAKSAGLMIKNHFLIGVGLNNFLVRLPEYAISLSGIRFFQPVHNLWLLIAAETGLIGLFFFLFFLFITLKKVILVRNWSLLAAWGIIFLTGFFDHYWLTLQQGQLLLALVWGLSWVRPGLW